MPFVPAPGIAEVQVRATYDGQQVMNRIMVDVLHTPTQGDLDTITAAVAAWWIGNVKALVAPTVSLRQVYARSLEVANGPESTFSAGLPSPGTAGGGGLPNSVALAVSLRTGLTGRSARGRWFWYGFTESQVTDSTVDTGVAVSIVAAIDNLLSVITGLSSQPVIVSYVTNNAPRPGGPVYFVINDALLVDQVVDSQRRRLPGRGS